MTPDSRKKAELEATRRGSAKIETPTSKTEVAVEEKISGPIPSGSEMRRYADVDPDLPAKILKDAAVRRDQRDARETLAINQYYASVRLGQKLSLVNPAVGFVSAIGAQILTRNVILSIAIAVVGAAAPLVVAAIRTKKESDPSAKE